MRKQTDYKRWKVFAGVWFQGLFVSATAFFSLFCIPFTKQLACSDADFSLAYTIYMLVYCAVGFFGGRLAERYKPKYIICIGAVLFSAGWFFTGCISSKGGLYFTYGILAGFGGGIMYPASIPTALKWFPEQNGRISGLLQTSYVFGPFILSPLVSRMIESLGAPSACKILGVAFLLTLCLSTPLISALPAEINNTSAPQPSAGARKFDYTTKEMIQTKAFGSCSPCLYLPMRQAQ